MTMSILECKVNDNNTIRGILRDLLNDLATGSIYGGAIRFGNIFIKNGKAFIDVMECDVIDRNTLPYSHNLAFHSPNVLSDNTISSTDDVWSLGILSLALATGELPYVEYPPMKVILCIIDPSYEKSPIDYYTDLTQKNGIKIPSKVYRFAERCLRFDEKKRYTVQKLLETKFIQS